MKWILIISFLPLKSAFSQSSIMFGGGIRSHTYTDADNFVWTKPCENCMTYLSDYEKVEKRINVKAFSLSYFHAFRLSDHFLFGLGADFIYSRLSYTKRRVYFDPGDFSQPLAVSIWVENRRDIDFTVPIRLGISYKNSEFFFGPSVGVLLYADYVYSTGTPTGKWTFDWFPPSATESQHRIWLDFVYNYRLFNQFKLGAELKFNVLKHDPIALVKVGYEIPQKNLGAED